LTWSMLSPLASGFDASWIERRTRGDSSASTDRARCAVDARCVEGKGIESVL
jgi:hypothetical protein